MTILVTGCAGYIGGTFSYEALKKGFKVIGCDSLVRSNPKTVENLESLFPESFTFFPVDICNKKELSNIFSSKKISKVIHFAALKSVSESESNPDLYWSNNVGGTEILLEVMKKAEVKELIFSSSAAVYGKSNLQPINEVSSTNPQSVYAKTKLAAEKLIEKYTRDYAFKAVSLRYFNPLGAHKDKIVYEVPDDNYGNIMPKLLCVLEGLEKEFIIYGNNYETRDGTGERDYLHISDLIDGHFCALKYLNQLEQYEIFNLGTGKGVTVLELIEAFIKVAKKDISYVIKDRRPGDIDVCFADPRKSNDILKWKSKKSLQDMCKDSINAIRNTSGR